MSHGMLCTSPYLWGGNGDILAKYLGGQPVTVVDIDPSGKLKQTLTFTLLKIEDGKAEIDVKGTIPSKSDKQSKDGMTHTMSMGGSESGKIPKKL